MERMNFRLSATGSILKGIKRNGWEEISLKDNLPHNTCQIYVKPHSKSTQMTLEYHIFDEKALK